MAKKTTFHDALNEHIAREFAAEQQYIAIAVYFDDLTLPQLAGRPFRVRDHEHGLDSEAALADRTGVALDEHRRLARPCSGGHEDRARRLDRRELLGVDGSDCAHRPTLLLILLLLVL